MKRGEVKLTMPDGDVRFISTAGGRELHLNDRAFAHLQAVIQDRRLRFAPRLDRELSWLRAAKTITGPEPDASLFRESKAFITNRLDQIEVDFLKLTRQRRES
jgi:hypothetical protein